MRTTVLLASMACLKRTMGGMLLIIGTVAQAQDEGLRFEIPGDPVSCLTSDRPQGSLPAYPTGVLPGTDAVVRVKLSFTSSDVGPAIDIAFNNAAPAFGEAVRQHVSSYRLPCLSAGQTFSGVQEFQFVTKAQLPAVIESAMRNDVDGELLLPPECMAGVKNVPPPVFPGPSLVSGQVRPGLVLARLRFEGPDQSPMVQILFDGGQPRLADAVRDSVSKYRLPCLGPSDPPFAAHQSFSFLYEGYSPGPRLKDELSLNQLLGLVKDMKSYKVRFDFSTMGCPFKLGFKPYQPYDRNFAREVGLRDPGRREFIEWLRNVTLDLPLDFQRTGLGRLSMIDVPCVLLDFS